MVGSILPITSTALWAIMMEIVRLISFCWSKIRTTTCFNFTGGISTMSIAILRCLSSKKKLGTSLSTISVSHAAILDFDGKNDLLLLLKSGQIQIHYNNNPNTQDLCVGVADPYDYKVSEHSIMHIQRVSLGGWAASDTAVLLFGDYDNDGYDDFSVTLIDPSTGYPRAMLFHNDPCTGNECGTFNPLFIQASSTLNTRTFTKYLSLYC